MSNFIFLACVRCQLVVSPAFHRFAASQYTATKALIQTSQTFIPKH